MKAVKYLATVAKNIVKKWRNWRVNQEANIKMVQPRQGQMNDIRQNENDEIQNEQKDVEYLKLFTKIFNILCGLTYVVGFDVRIPHKFNIRLVLAFIASMSGVLSCLFTPMLALANIPKLIEALCLWGMAVPALLKYVVFLSRRLRVFYPTHFVKKILKDLAPSRINIINEELKSALVKIKFLLLAFLVGFSLFSIYPVYAFVTERKLVPIMSMEYPLINQEEPVGYILAFCIMFCTSVVASSGSVGYDMNLAFAVFNYGGLVRLFEEDLKDFHKMWENKKEYSDQDRNYYLRNICIKYQDISAFVKYVNAFYSDSICCSVSAQYLALILAVYASIYNGWMSGYGYCIILFLQLYILCYLGTYIDIQNEKLNRMIYFTPWYEYPVGYQKIILNLLHASSFNATVIWIGPFAPLNVQTGKMMTSNIYTYNTALASVEV